MNKFLAVTISCFAALSVASSAAHASTIGQREALQSAQSYLDMGGFSRAGLIHQLTSSYGEGFSQADAIWAVDHSHANWNAEAVQSAKSYLAMGGLLSGESDSPTRVPIR